MYDREEDGLVGVVGATHESCAGERHVVGALCHACYLRARATRDGRCRQTDRHEHRLVPVGIHLSGPALLDHIVDQARDVVERIAVHRRAIGCGETRLIVGNAVLGEERMELVERKDQHRRRRTEEEVGTDCVVDARESHLRRVERVVLVSPHDLIHRQRDLGEEARRAFQITASRLCRETCQQIVVVAERRRLQHLLRTGQ